MWQRRQYVTVHARCDMARKMQMYSQNVTKSGKVWKGRQDVTVQARFDMAGKMWEFSQSVTVGAICYSWNKMWQFRQNMTVHAICDSSGKMWQFRQGMTVQARHGRADKIWWGQAWCDKTRWPYPHTLESERARKFALTLPSSYYHNPRCTGWIKRDFGAGYIF